MGRKTKSTRQTMIDAEPDMISNLPGHVTDQILSCLSIREAVRTSVLSKIWKNKWYTLPNLVFDRHSVSESMLLKTVDHVLLVHSGPIKMFKFANDCPGLSEIFEIDMDRWILHLTRRSIKELVLEVWITKERYKLPWCLFTCQSLHHLKLKWCLLKPPKTFEGFRNLKSLELEGVRVAPDDFENLISGCPLLEKLKLIVLDRDGITQINIHAPNLKVFKIYGRFDGISLDNTFKLSRVVVDSWLDLISEDNESTLPGRPSNLLNFFDNRPHIKSLVIGSYFLKYLAAGDFPVKLPTPCVDLSYLSLSINFNDLKEISAALFLLRSSPNLQKLEISAHIEAHNVPLTPVSDGYSWEDVFSRPVTPIQVRHVTIDSISGFQPELDLIKFLLLYSPVLEKIIVKPLVNARVELLIELVRFKRASEEAEVIYEVQKSIWRS
ncbi:F-box/FBD/LRR-repeat protein At1g13570-like isoform X1 [Vicia villosa]|uniref:F-box/FBD/LRR-repeat protein At1g13570-like isoform X1 n=1 Tax=Vicia villosa TaxID=3911 RepID=UPI00273ACA23|nr:F-box/FBD/LRR-repeat protein At1g13570-like isoform X1 [Vicia villosa]XP_058724946.1 F-box/FBD/LRR-repeat protein At1g13570-like isoform X1 [Vicia villosa]